jgi:hypothetical protein
MDDRLGAFKAILFGIADAATFLLTTPAGIALGLSFLLVAACARLWTGLSDRRLAGLAAGETFGLRAAAGAALREIVAMIARAAGALPTLIGVAVLLVLVSGVADSIRAVDEFAAGQRRIAELNVTVRNLERRYRAVEARIDDLREGRILATLSFFDYRDPKAPPKSQSIDLPGKELFIDALVCNFDYSAIAAGRSVNLAIPFKVFTDSVPEAEGVPLAMLDEAGIPYIYRRSPGEVYGIGPEAYSARVSELVAAMRSDEAARKEGIVRSLYGDAVHRAARKGEAFTVWVEQSGGLTIKDDSSF